MKTITDEQFEKYEYALNATQSRETINTVLEHIMLWPEQDYTNVKTSDAGDIWHLKEVKLPKEGGILTYYDEHIYPKKGFPVEAIVERVDIVKKFIMAGLHGLSKSKIILGLTVLFFRKDLIEAYDVLLVKLCDLIGHNVLVPSRYCKSVREIYKAFDEKDNSIRTIATTILEFDDAYRYRFQDIVGELDKQNFEKNPYKELARLLTLVEFRENDDRLKETWARVRKALFIIFFSRELREKIITFFSKLDIEKIKMEEDDMYYAKLKKGGWGYKWGDSPAS